MTDTISGVALAFCKEVLGWENAFHQGDGYIVSRGQTHASDRVWGPHDTHNLNTVLPAVRKAAGTGTVRLESQTLEPPWYAEVWMETPGGSFRKGQSRQSDPAHALMAACLDAQRKLREGI
jgi:hypothetical protein